MIPKIIQAYEQRLPSDLNYWFLNIDGEIKLFSDAIKSPEIYVNNSEIKIKGEWIYKRGNYVIRKEEEKEEVIYSNVDAVDFVYIDGEIRPVEKKGKNIIFNKEKYLAFHRRFSFSVFENKDKVRIFSNGKEIELDKPISYRITPSYVNLVYDDYSIVVDINGNRLIYKKPDFYLGKSSKGRVFQTSAGKIVIEDELLGICSSEAYYLGETPIGVVIVCGNKIKYFYRGAWSYLSNTSNLVANYANYNFVITTDAWTTVYDGMLKKIFDLNNIIAVIADRKYIYTITSSRKIYLIEPSEDYFPLEIAQDPYGIIITIDKSLYNSLKLGKGLIKVSEDEENGKVKIRVEPTKLAVTTKSQIEVNVELFTYKKEIVIPPLEPEIILSEGYILLAKNGRVKNTNEYYNAILKAKLKYKIPSKLASAVELKILGREYTFLVENSEGEILIELPLVKLDSNEEILFLSIERNGITETLKEYVIKVKEVEEKKSYKAVEQIENATRRKIVKSEDEYFEWTKVEEYPDIYDNVIIAKEGDLITIEGQKTEVKAGVQKIMIQRDNYMREYIVYGMPNPIRGVKAFIQGNKLHVNIDLAYKLPITVIYGTQIATNTRGDFVFDLDPVYSTVIVKAYYSENIRWEFKYELNELLKNALIEAEKTSMIIREQLSIYGIL